MEILSRNAVRINGCQSLNNVALRTESKDQKFGGNAIFMSTKDGKVTSNTMIGNSGDSAVKIFNHFPEYDLSNNKLMALEQGTVIISDCRFKNPKDSKRFIYYYLENDASKFELVNCYFYG